MLKNVSQAGIQKSEKSRKRTVYAPRPERGTEPPAVVSVVLDEGEDVEWIWTHTADGNSVVTGYIITKRTDKPRQQSAVSDDSNRTSSRGVGDVREASEEGSGLGKDRNHLTQPPSLRELESSELL